MNNELRDLAVDALRAQEAVNLSGVVHAFSRAMSKLRELEPDRDTDYYNWHPLAVLFADKIADLAVAGSNRLDAYSHAYAWALKQREAKAE
jgi:hypothetical protein